MRRVKKIRKIKRWFGGIITVFLVFFFIYCVGTALDQDHRSQCGEKSYSSYHDACITVERPWEK